MTWLDAFLSTPPAAFCDSEDVVGAQDVTLEALCASATPEDAADLRQERAAILEHDAGLPRDVAERRAGVA